MQWRSEEIRGPVTSDEIEFKTKAEIRDKGGYHIMINGSIQEDIIVNIHISFSSVQSLIMSDSLRPHELQHAIPPCPSPTPGVDSNPCPLS